MNHPYYQEFLGSMKQFEPITSDQVKKESKGVFGLDELSIFLLERGLSSEKVVYDPTRLYLNTFYADYENGLYIPMLLSRIFLKHPDSFDSALEQHRKAAGLLQNKDWSKFYEDHVPTSMLIYDFERRLYDIEPEKVFDIWLRLYTRIDFSNGQWDPQTLDYVFAHAQKPSQLPQVNDKSEMITIYRGMGSLSQSAETAISWSSNPVNALWFANRSGCGKALAVGEIPPQEVVAYRTGFWNENEIIVRPYTVRNIRYENMIPVTKENVLKLAVPALPDYMRYGKQVERLGYKPEGSFSYHGSKHLSLTKKEYQISHLIIQYHCLDDDTGIQAIQALNNCTKKEKEHVVRLYQICKDMDALDRVRFNGLNYQKLRTSYSRQLPLIAGELLKEDIMSIL